MMFDKADSRIGIPLYRQVCSMLLQKILDCEYKSGCLLPSEKILEEQFAVSRITVRRAIDDLQKDRIVLKQPGIGTLVLDNKIPLQLSAVSGFRDENKHLSEWMTSGLISCELVTPDLKVQTYLELSPQDKVYCLQRIRYFRGENVGFHRAYFPKNLVTVPKDYFKDKNASLYDLFRSNGVIPHEADERISAILPTEAIQDYLNIDSCMPVLFKERKTFSYKHIPIEFVEIYYRSDKYQYEVKILEQDSI